MKVETKQPSPTVTHSHGGRSARYELPGLGATTAINTKPLLPSGQTDRPRNEVRLNDYP